MRRYARGLATGAIAFALLGASDYVWAQQPPSNTPNSQAVTPAPTVPAPIIVVVDPQAAIQMSKAGQGIRQSHDKYLQGFEGELQAGRKALADQESELTKQKGHTPMDEWQKKAQAFDAKVVEFNQKFQKVNLAVEKSYRAALNELGQVFTNITAEVANEAGANLVLPKSQVILHEPRMDLTKLVIERMDKRYPSINFPPPEFETDAASPGQARQPGKK